MPRKTTSISESPATRVKAAAPKATVKRHNKATASAPIPRKPASYEEIAQLAFSYWEQRGHADGCPESDWLRAEQELQLRQA